MKAVLYVTMAVLVIFAVSGRGQQPQEPGHGAKADMPEAVFKNYKDLKWDKILPDAQDYLTLAPLPVRPRAEAPRRETAPRRAHTAPTARRWARRLRTTSGAAS